MNKSEVKIYNRILATKPQNWLDDSFKPVFEDYCSWVHRQNIICELIRKTCEKGLPKDADKFKRFEKLVNLSVEISGLISRLATTLRITPQARYTAKSAATAHAKNSTKPPWLS
jgi:hypothetical protein